jgi:hypothetical protein
VAGRKSTKTKRVTVTVTEPAYDFLDRLSEIGIHGGSPTEVARKLIENEIERLVRDGILKLPPVTST